MAQRTRLRLRVVPGTTHPGVVGRLGDRWKVRVTAPPEDGKANHAVLAMLADVLGVERGDLALTSGHASRDKVIDLDGLTAADADTRLAAAAKGGAA